MYELIYNKNFFYNFFPSFLIILSLILISFHNFNFIKNKTQIFDNTRPIFIFYSFFGLSTIIFNLLIIFDNFQILKIFKYLLFFLCTIFLFNYKLFINNYKKLRITGDVVLILLLLTLFFLISILPLSDADSIAVHLRSATHIFLYGLKNLDYTLNHEFLSISNAEILLLFSPILQSDNFGSQLNFFSLILFVLVYWKKFSFTKFILTCPLMLFLISTQKLQLFFGILYLYLFILVFEKKIKSKIEIFFFLFLLAFYSSGKINYILFAIPLYFYFLLSLKKYLKFNIIISFIVFFVVLFPIFFLKFKYFGNPIAPFFDNLFGSSRIIFQEYQNSLRSSQGWLNNFKDISIYIQPFFPIKLANITNSLGLIFLLLFFNYNLQKKLNYFPAIIFILIIATGQILPRYYFEAFLLLIYFYNNSKNKLFYFVTNIQYVFMIVACSIFLYLSYFQLNVLFDKINFMKSFSYGYSNFLNYNKYLDIGNVFVASDGRGNIFSKEGIYPRNSLEIQNTKLINSQNLTSFFKDKNIKIYISINDKLISKCISYNIIDKFNSTDARRNFLVKNKQLVNVYKIDYSKC